MKLVDISKLEDLSIRLGGLQSMSSAIRDCVLEGLNSIESYEDAIDLQATLMFEFRNDYTAAVEEIITKIGQEKTA